MAARPCNISLTGCAGADSPITNISAEAPDPLLFAGIPYDPFDWHAPPRLGNGLKVDTDCPHFLSSVFANYSPVIYAQTQLMANLQALAAELGCTWPENGDQIYTNDAQTATVYCPDGTAFTYTVDAGTLTSPLLDTELGAAFVIAANAWASAYAFEQASALMDCIDPDPDTPPEPGPRKPTIPLGPGILPGPVWMCFGAELFHRYRVSGRGAAEYTLSITAGALPPGTTFTQDGPKTGFISGTPTAPGEYSFTITGVSTSLPTVTVEVTDYVWVMGITNADTLPDATNGTAYSEQLLGTGGTAPYTFATTDALPTGLTLASDGTISGTPSVDGNFTFDVTMTDANDGECTQTVLLTIFPILVCASCGYPDVLAGLVDPGGCGGSANPAWNGIFDQNIFSVANPTFPIYYFLTQSILGTSVSADDTPNYPVGNWMDTDVYASLAWNGANWILSIQCNAGGVFWSGTGPATILNAAGLYTYSSGSSIGITSIRVNARGTGYCIGLPLPINWPLPQPARVRVVNYAGVLAAFGLCPACDTATSEPAWDGTLPTRYAPDPSTTKYWPAGAPVVPFGPIPPLSIANKIIHDGTTIGIGMFVEINRSPPNYWRFRISCMSGGVEGAKDIWDGTKNVGLDATGVYIRLGTPQTGSGPACISFESY